MIRQYQDISVIHDNQNFNVFTYLSSTQKPLVFTLSGAVWGYTSYCDVCRKIVEPGNHKMHRKSLIHKTQFNTEPLVATLDLQRGFLYRRRLPIHKWASTRRMLEGTWMFYPVIDTSGKIVVFKDDTYLKDKEPWNVRPVIDRHFRKGMGHLEKMIMSRFYISTTDSVTCEVGIKITQEERLVLFKIVHGGLVIPQEENPLFKYLFPFTRLRYT